MKNKTEPHFIVTDTEARKYTSQGLLERCLTTMYQYKVGEVIRISGHPHKCYRVDMQGETRIHYFQRGIVRYDYPPLDENHNEIEK